VNSPADRLAVPTNGHRPAALADDALDGPDLDPADEGDSIAAVLPSVSPGQVIVGFGVLAALILLLLGRRRGRSD
jgi:hypothetical protein